MKGFEIIVLANLVNCHSKIQGHLALGGIKRSELENLNLIENVKPEWKVTKTGPDIDVTSNVSILIEVHGPLGPSDALSEPMARMGGNRGTFTIVKLFVVKIIGLLVDLYFFASS